MFSTLSLAEQLEALLGSFSPLDMDGVGDLRIVEACVGRERVIVVGFDGDRHRGSVGVRETDQLVAVLGRAILDQSPVVLLMDTAGVRVTEDIASVGALRRWLRAALDAVISGVPMLALITRNCFGGASILSTLCDRRAVSRSSLIAMSGPRLIQGMASAADGAVAQGEASRSILGGETRAAVSERWSLIEDDARSYREYLTDWVEARGGLRIQASELTTTLGSLRNRLQASGRWGTAREVGEVSDHQMVSVAAELLGARTRLVSHGALVLAETDDQLDARLFGLVGGGLARPEDVLRLAEAVAHVPPSVKHLHLLLDCESHSTSADDERMILSEFLGVLALQIRQHHYRAVLVRVVVTGVAGGGVFAALASAASSVCMLPSARLCVLPAAAMQAIHKAEIAGTSTPLQALEAAAIDAVHGDRLEGSAIGR